MGIAWRSDNLSLRKITEISLLIQQKKAPIVPTKEAFPTLNPSYKATTGTKPIKLIKVINKNI